MTNENLYTKVTLELIDKRTALALEFLEAWNNFSKTVFKDGALPEKIKILIAIAATHAMQRAFSIRSHTKQAMRKGANNEEIMEAIWVASEMREGAAYAHATVALNEMM